MLVRCRRYAVQFLALILILVTLAALTPLAPSPVGRHRHANRDRIRYSLYLRMATLAIALFENCQLATIHLNTAREIGR